MHIHVSQKITSVMEVLDLTSFFILRLMSLTTVIFLIFFLFITRKFLLPDDFIECDIDCLLAFFVFLDVICASLCVTSFCTPLSILAFSTFNFIPGKSCLEYISLLLIFKLFTFFCFLFPSIDNKRNN